MTSLKIRLKINLPLGHILTDVYHTNCKTIINHLLYIELVLLLLIRETGHGDTGILNLKMISIQIYIEI